MRRSLALTLAIIAPLTIVILQVAVGMERDGNILPKNDDAWLYFSQGVMVFWGLLMIPLFVTLVTALAGGLEHNNSQWKHLYALPIPRAAVYAAKQFAGMAYIGISSLCLPVFTVLGGLFLRLARPEIGFSDSIPWQRLLLFTGMVYLSSWLIIAVQTWIDLRWKSFVISCAVGIVMTIAGIVIVRADWGTFYPWALPGFIGNEFAKNVIHTPELLVGCLGGLAVALLGGLDVTRHDVF